MYDMHLLPDTFTFKNDDNMIDNELYGHFFNRTIFYIDHDTHSCLLYTSPSPRDRTRSRMPSSA